MNLKEFFEHAMNEGPRDGTFKPAPEIKPADGMDPEADAGALPGAEDPMTQDVAAMSASSLQFFSKNVGSVNQKLNLEGSGFDVAALEQYASGLDGMVFQLYQQVQEPTDRQAFEADYQKLAADWSKDLSKFFEKLLKLKSHTNQY